MVSSQNPYDILTDDELELSTIHLENKLKGKKLPVLPKELQEKLKLIEQHPTTIEREKKFKRLSEAEQQKEIERLERKLDFYNEIDS